MNRLVWKQWRENRGYLAAFTAWMVLAVCYCVGYEWGYGFRACIGQFSGWAMFYSLVAAIVLAMQAAVGEHAAGTLSFSASLPVSLRRMAAVRIGAAAMTLAIPILIAALLLSVALAGGLLEQAEPREAEQYQRLVERGTASLPVALEQLASVMAIAIFGGIQLLLVLAVCGCWLRKQAQVGLLGAVLALGSLIASGVLWYGERQPFLQMAYGAVLPQSLVIHWGYGAEHGGTYTDHELAAYRWFALALAIPVLTMITLLFIQQGGRVRNSARSDSTAKPRRLRFATPSLLSHIPWRLRSRWGALIWIELRQSLPLVVFGLLFASLIAVLTVVMEPTMNYATGQRYGIRDSALAEMPHTVAFVGILWAVVVGSGLYSAELGSGLGAFWRSRPISPGRWFWCKFIVGMTAVLGVLDGVTILASWNAPRESMTTGMSWAYVGCFPLLHALVYALAVLGTCWLRKPVIGGFVAIFGYGLLTIMLSTFPATESLEPVNIYNDLLHAERAGQIDFMQHGYPLVYGTLSVLVLLLALLSSRLARPLQPTFRWFDATTTTA